MSGNEGTSAALRLDVAADGIGLIWIDCPGERVNTVSRAVFTELEALAARVRLDRGVRALVLISAKPDTFVAGADLSEIRSAATPQQAEEASRWAQRVFQALWDLPQPVVAAIHGTCLGGGMELALACKYRVATDHPKTQLGQPEVQMGVLPGAGGTQRLPPLVGIRRALDLVMSGRALGARDAHRWGLVDEVVPRSILQDAATKAARGLADGTLHPVRRAGAGAAEIVSSGSLLSLAGLSRLALELNPIGRKVVFSKAAEEAAKKGGPHYPAPMRALQALRIGIEEGPASGYAAESSFFGELAASATSKNLIRIFFATTQAKKSPPDLGEGDRARPLARLGILGAGLMGAGIAEVAAARGLEVRLRDRSLEDLGRGLASIHQAAQGRVKRRRLTAREARDMLDRVSPTVDFTGFGRVDCVIEAVPEIVELKHQVIQEIEARIPAGAIFASNTSAIPIATLARVSVRPEQFIGMHFFSPVPRMPLVEIITTDRTARWVTETIRTLTLALGKTPIVVKDGPGFYTTRALGIFLMEAVRMLEEGAGIEAVDKAMMQLGFPVGPFRLADEVGLDVAHHVGQTIAAAFPDRVKPSALMDRMQAEGRKGKRGGKGFYTYAPSGERFADHSLEAHPGAVFASPDIIQARLLSTFIVEAIRCLEEGILSSPRDGDLGAVLGLGFPAYLGGPFVVADQKGAQPLADELARLADRHGPVYAPPTLLKEMAAARRTFYPA